MIDRILRLTVQTLKENYSQLSKNQCPSLLSQSRQADTGQCSVLKRAGFHFITPYAPQELLLIGNSRSSQTAEFAEGENFNMK